MDDCMEKSRPGLYDYGIISNLQTTQLDAVIPCYLRETRYSHTELAPHFEEFLQRHA
jgi:hypothetical protein